MKSEQLDHYRKILKIVRRWAWLRTNGDVDVCAKVITRRWMRAVKAQTGTKDRIVRVKIVVLE